MKKIAFILAGVLALSAVSCNKTSGVDEPAAAKVKLSVGITTPATRATGVTAQAGRNDSSDEAKVNTLQVFVFNGDALDGYGSSTGSMEATVSCTAGSRDIYALVNAPSSLNSITSKAALLASVSTLVEDPDNFEMIGSKTETLQFDGKVTIPVDRLAARIVIRKITNGFDNDAQANDFKLESIYITNATGDVNYGLSSDYAPALWYNKRGYEASNNLGSFNYDAIPAASQTIAKGASHETAHFFYSMPNGYEGKVGLAAGETAFTPRAVRLLIRVRIAGTLYNYPILFPALQSNRSYEINELVITRVGNPDDDKHDPDDPDDIDEEKPIVGFEQGFEITVNDWTVVLVDGGNITI